MCSVVGAEAALGVDQATAGAADAVGGGAEPELAGWRRGEERAMVGTALAVSVDDDAKAACAGFTSQVTVPAVGDRVRATGAYVTDKDNGWNEIHPVTRIDVLR